MTPDPAQMAKEIGLKLVQSRCVDELCFNTQPCLHCTGLAERITTVLTTYAAQQVREAERRVWEEAIAMLSKQWKNPEISPILREFRRRAASVGKGEDR